MANLEQRLARLEALTRQQMDRSFAYYGFEFVGLGQTKTGRFFALKASGGDATLVAAGTITAAGSQPSGSALTITKDDMFYGNWNSVQVGGASAGSVIAFNMPPDDIRLSGPANQ